MCCKLLFSLVTYIREKSAVSLYLHLLYVQLQLTHLVGTDSLELTAVCYCCHSQKSCPRFQKQKRIPLNEDYRDKEHEITCLSFILRYTYLLLTVWHI